MDSMTCTGWTGQTLTGLTEGYVRYWNKNPVWGRPELYAHL